MFPLLFITASSRLGIEPIRFFRVVRGIDVHALRSRCFKVFNVWGSGSALTVAAIIPQAFSIGDKSGELGGQSPGEMYPVIFLFNPSDEAFDVCARAPSC